MDSKYFMHHIIFQFDNYGNEKFSREIKKQGIQNKKINEVKSNNKAEDKKES